MKVVIALVHIRVFSVKSADRIAYADTWGCHPGRPLVTETGHMTSVKDKN